MSLSKDENLVSLLNTLMILTLREAPRIDNLFGLIDFLLLTKVIVSQMINADVVKSIFHYA
jgi:hypothetical protein